MSLSVLIDPFTSFWNNTGSELASTIEVYDAGGAKLAKIYTTAAGNILAQNPLPLLGGRATIYATDGTPYKVILRDNSGSVLKTEDNLYTTPQTGIDRVDVYIKKDNIAAMDADASITVGEYHRTAGYISGGDGGNNDYEIVGGGTAPADGGSYINLTASGLQAKGLFPGGAVNEKQFGITGTGDETVKYQALLDYIQTNTIRLDQKPYTTTALTSTDDIIEWPTGRIILTDPLNQNNLSDAPPLVFPSIGGKHAYSVRNGSLTENDIYEPIFPNIKHYGCLNGVTQVVLGSDIEHATGIAGYIRTDTAAPTNAVAIFGCGMSTVDNAAVWGINTLLQDQATRVAGTLTGQVLVNELDFNIMNPGTQVIGLSIGGNSLAQPTNAIGFVVNQLGTGFKWNTGFAVQDGACSDIGVSLGLITATGNNINSCKLNVSATNSTGTKINATLQAIGAGNPILQWSGMDFKLSTQSLLLDSGEAYIVNGMSVLTDRQTGWSATTGTELRTDFGDSSLTDTSQALRALIVDLKTHGMIGA